MNKHLSEILKDGYHWFDNHQFVQIYDRNNGSDNLSLKFYEHEFVSINFDNFMLNILPHFLMNILSY